MPAPGCITAGNSQQCLADVATLVAGVFGGLEDLGRLEPVGSGDLPTSYDNLLDHRDHMTVTHEAIHESLVDLVVLAERRLPDGYCRASLLVRRSDSLVLQFGVMRIATPRLPAPVREAIERHSAPLGRVMIRHNLLREVELLALYRYWPTPLVRQYFGLDPGEPVYGRLAQILIDGVEAVEVLECVTDSPRTAVTNCITKLA